MCCCCLQETVSVNARRRHIIIFGSNFCSNVNMDIAASSSLPRSSAPLAFAKSTKCALCIIPDESLWPGIQRTRLVHDAHAVRPSPLPPYNLPKKRNPKPLINVQVRWMPHINLLFPFVDAAQLADAAAALSSRLASVAPFEVQGDRPSSLIINM